MKLIKPLFILIAIVFVLLAFVQFFIFLTPEVSGQEEQYNPEYHLDLTLSYEFGEVAPMVERLLEEQSVTGSNPVLSTMTATVVETNCGWCLRNLNPSKCLIFCGNIIID